jgi:hypothetical protein
VPGVFDERVGEERTPAELGGIWCVGEGLDGSRQERGQRRERGLAVLVLRKVVVGFQMLQPDASLDGVLADGVVEVVVVGEEVAGDAIVGAYVSTRRGDG